MVQRGKSLRVQSPQRLDFGHERRQQECLDQAIFVAKGDTFGIVLGQLLQFFATPVLLLQNGKQLLMVESLCVVEMDCHLLAERFVAVGNHVKQVAHWDDVTDLERVALIDQQLHHHLQCRPFSLKNT